MTISSICIPRVDMSVSRNYIEDVISNMNIGNIEKLNEIPLRKDPTHKRVIMKMRWDKNNVKTKEILNKMTEFGSVKLVYNMPWYWKVCPAR
jgi:hypothetical protein